MSEETKIATEVAEETTSVEVDANTQSTQGAPEAAESAADVDYKAEAERYKKIAEKQAGALRQERKRRKEVEPTHNDVEDADNGLGVVQRAVDEAIQAYDRRRSTDIVDEVIDSITSNPDEAQAIRVIYKNRITPSGFSKHAIKRDLLDAQLIANRSRFMANAEQKARKAVAQEVAMKGASGSARAHVDEPIKSEEKLSKADRELYRKWGVTLK